MLICYCIVSLAIVAMAILYALNIDRPEPSTTEIDARLSRIEKDIDHIYDILHTLNGGHY